jgi:arginase
MLSLRPVVLGGCCCSHVGAARGLASRVERLGVVWFDAHGDLNTPESSPSGNLWGMPLRMLLDDGVVATSDVALVGTRNLDPPEGIRGADGDRRLARARRREASTRFYVALDLDVLDPEEADIFMPEPDGPSVAEIEAVLLQTRSHATIAGIGVTGFLRTERNVPIVSRMLAAAGF